MHELTIADRLLDRALEAAVDSEADRIDRISVSVGAATHINTDQLEFWLHELAAETPAEGMRIEIRTIAATGRCSCGWHGELPTLDVAFAAAPDRRCPECGERTELTAGVECRLDSVSVPEPDKNESAQETGDNP